MAHEKTRGFGFDGREHIFPSVDPKTGKNMSDVEIIKRFKSGTLKPIRILPSVRAGKKFAERRSQSFGRPRNPSAAGKLSDNPTK